MNPTPLALPPAATALADLTGWRRWWLPQNYSTHGGELDLLFNVIFLVCAAVALGVFFFLIKFCVQYRHRPHVKKAHFSHGNKRLELIWTVIPAVLLLALSLWANDSWTRYRYSPKTAEDPERAQILVIGQQFKWNVIYPGPDKKLGRYLVFPKVTDTKWPAGSGLESTTGVPGPAYLSQKKAEEAINSYIQSNPMGKDMSDPAGVDDDWKDALNRTLVVPKGRPVDIHLSSRDVLHDFFLPEFRVKLDAVPGMRGHVYFTATTTNAELEKQTLKDYPVAELAALTKDERTPQYRFVVPAGEEAKYKIVELVPATKKIRDPKNRQKQIVVPDPDKPPTEETRDLIRDGDIATKELVERVQKPVWRRFKLDDLSAATSAAGAAEHRFVVTDVADEKVKAAVKNDEVVTPAAIAKLKEAGVAEVTASHPLAAVRAYKAKNFEIVCEELCGNGHTAMKGLMVVVEPDEYVKRFETPASSTPPATPVAVRD